MTKAWKWAACAAGLAIAAPASAGVTGYLKIPDIDGESKRDSGEAHLDYLVITMEASEANEAAHVVQQRGSTANAGKDHEDWIPVLGVDWQESAATRDAATGMPTGRRQHKPLTVVKEVDKATPEATAIGSSTSGAAGAGKVKFDRLTMKKSASVLPPRRMTGAGSVSLPLSLPGCRVGARYPHALVGDEGGREVKLMGVSVAQCASEQVTLNYEKIKWRY